MRSKELRSKSVEELTKIADELRKKINQLLIEKSLKKLAKPHFIKLTKRDLARVLTVLREKLLSKDKEKNTN